MRPLPFAPFALALALALALVTIAVGAAAAVQRGLAPSGPPHPALLHPAAVRAVGAPAADPVPGPRA